MNELPQDPVMLASVINTKLRDIYSDGLDALCRDMDLDRSELESKLAEAGYVYLPDINQFR